MAAFQSPMRCLESSASVLDVLSPSSRQYKRRRSAFGEAMRIKTVMLDEIVDTTSKENIENVETSKESARTPVKCQTNLLNSVQSPVRETANRPWSIDDFTLSKPLGKGKFGNVYLAKQKQTSVTVALKVLFKSKMKKQTIKMLKREVEIQYRLSHPNINKLFG
jgi:hypothetical protein